MKRLTLAIAMAALVLFAGCKKETETTGTTIKASIEQCKGDGSKTTIVPDGTEAEIRWTTGDEILVNNGTMSGIFTLVGAGGSTSGDFSYNGEYTFGSTNVAVYPAENTTISGNTVTVNMPDVVEFDANKNGANPMLGIITNPAGFTMKSLCGVLGISLKAKSGTVDIKAVEVVSNSSTEKLNGKFTADATATEDDLKLVKSGDDGTNSVRLNCTTTLNTTETKYFYFALPVGALASGGFTLNVYGDGPDPIFTKTAGNTPIALNWVNQMPTLEVVLEHTYVDLGLPSGLLWATCNVGANAPEEYGDYFAWGETQPKSSYTWSNYQYCNGTRKTLTKYCNVASYGYNGFTDGLTTLLPEDDAATVNWGSDWRMPTKEEWQELFTNTTCTWTIQNGVNGRLFTASNSNSIFLPAAGSNGSSFGTYGHYWSSSIYTNEGPDWAWHLEFWSEDHHMPGFDRDYGYSVRAVRPGL